MTARQKLCIAKLAMGASVAAVARDLGISEKTIWGYLKEPAFRDARDALIDEIVGDATRQLNRELSAAGPEFLATIRELAKDEKAGKRVQLHAAIAGLAEARRSDGRKRR